VFVILFFFCAITVAVTHEFSQPFYKFVAVFGLLVLLLTLLLFISLCADVRHLRNREEPHPFAFFGSDTEIGELLQTAKTGGLVELAKSPPRDVGDRKFKADATKVCKNCKWIEESTRICRKDDLSLEGITVGAVGCQHWALGLTVTETEPRREGRPDGKNSAESEET